MLSNNRAKQSDPRLAQIMYNRILRIYKRAHDQKQTKHFNAAEVLAGLTKGNSPSSPSPNTPNSTPPNSPQKPLPSSETSTSTTQESPKQNTVTSASNLDDKSMTNNCFDDPELLQKIQPRADQIWNADEIGIDPNGKWNKIVFKLGLRKIWGQN